MSTVISYIRCDCGSSLRVRGDDDRTLSEIARFFKRHFKCTHVGEVMALDLESTPEVQDCSREYGHSGPCNGWPCAYVRKKLDFGRNYGMSGVRAAKLMPITDQEALEKLERMFGRDKTPRRKSKHYSKKEVLTFKPLRDAIRRFFDTDGPYV